VEPEEGKSTNGLDVSIIITDPVADATLYNPSFGPLSIYSRAIEFPINKPKFCPMSVKVPGAAVPVPEATILP